MTSLIDLIKSQALYQLQSYCNASYMKKTSTFVTEENHSKTVCVFLRHVNKSNVSIEVISLKGHVKYLIDPEKN